MASVYNSVTNNSYSSSIKGYGGLASGLDRDSLIEGMTASTRAKIAKQQKSKQTLQWKQDAYRSISSKLVEFSKKYTSYTNTETNLFSTAFWTKSAATPKGVNSQYVQVTGSPTSSGNISITGVEQLAKRAAATSNTSVSNGVLTTGSIDFSDEKAVSNLEGQTLEFKVGDETFKVALKSVKIDDNTYDFSNAANAKRAIEEALKGVTVGDKKLADLIEVETDGDTNHETKEAFSLSFKASSEADPEKEIRLTGGSEKALKALGFEDGKISEDFANDGKNVINDSGFVGKSELEGKGKTFSYQSFKDRIDGKKMEFTYNGTSKSINLKYNDGDDLKTFASNIQSELNAAFGKDRIKVGYDDTTKKLTFQTQTPDGNPDSTSELTVGSISGDIGQLLGVKGGQANRLSNDTLLSASGLTFSESMEITINDITIKAEADWTVGKFIEEINAKTGVTVTYMKNADRFSIISKEEGASGEVKLDKNAADVFGIEAEGDVKKELDEEGNETGNLVIKGQDAIINVRYGDSTDPVKLQRGSNSFNLDGMNVTVSGTFNIGGTDSTQEVALDAKADNDKIVKAVSDMVKDYNELIKLINDEVSTRPNRKYEPLTDEQKEGMTETQIEKWEEEAKKGMLFSDPELRSLTDSMRFIFGSGSDEIALMDSFGITKSTDYGDNGALKFDETKFRKALEDSGDKVQELFTRAADKEKGDRGGFMTRLTDVTKQYAATTGSTKGSLIEKAGSILAPTSILSNTLKKSMDSIDKQIERLQAQLKLETDRYVKQFTSLETLISQMNSQSSWLSSTFGG